MPIIEISEDDVPSEQRRVAIQEEIDYLMHYGRGLTKPERDFLIEARQFVTDNGFLRRGQREILDGLQDKQT